MLFVERKIIKPEDHSLDYARLLVQPVIDQFWASYSSKNWIPETLQEVTRSPDQIHESGGGIHFLACGERIICFSHLFSQAKIPHKLCLSVIKRPLQSAKLGASLELDISGGKIAFVSATSREFVTDQLPDLKGSTKAVLRIDPVQDLAVGFYEAFGFTPETNITREPFSCSLLTNLRNGSTQSAYERSQRYRNRLEKESGITINATQNCNP